MPSHNFLQQLYRQGVLDEGATRVVAAGDQAWADFLAEKMNAGRATPRPPYSPKPPMKIGMGRALLYSVGALSLLSILTSGAPPNRIPDAANVGLAREQWRVLAGTAPNAFDGMPHGGLAQDMRRSMTDFGSRWDRARALAKAMGETLETFVKRKDWREAIASAKYVRTLGEGVFGEAHLMRMRYRGEDIMAVRKVAKPMDPFSIEGEMLDLIREGRIQQKFSEGIVPSVYSVNERELWMEHMPGETFDQLVKQGKEVPSFAFEEVRQQMEAVARSGFVNVDIHANNLLYDPIRRRAAWIDFGAALEQREARFYGWRPEEMREAFYTTYSYIGKKMAAARRGSAQTILKEAASQKSMSMLTPLQKPNSLLKREVILAQEREGVVDGLAHGGMAGSKRAISGDFGSPWKGLFGGISRKITKYFAKGGTRKLMDPRKAAKVAHGASLDDFVKGLGEQGIIARDIEGEAIYSAVAAQAPGTRAGAAYVTFATGEGAIMMSPQRLRESFLTEATRLGMAPGAAQRAVQSEDFLKTVFYHEMLEKQAKQAFTHLPQMPAGHHATQVIVGEGGFVQQLGNQDVKQLFSLIRKSRREEYAAFSAGLEAFGESGVAPRLRKLITDFGSGYRGVLDAASRVAAKRSVQSSRAARKLTESAQDLKIAQEQIWKWAEGSGQGHVQYAGDHVKQLSRFGGGI